MGEALSANVLCRAIVYLGQRALQGSEYIMGEHLLANAM